MEKIKSDGSNGKKWMDNKNVLKITSLLLATILWLYVAVTQDPNRTDRVENVEVICGLSQHQINQGLSIISKSSDKVSFEANGKRSLVTVVRGAYYAKLDLENISAPGKYNITPDISRPDGVYINDVTPSFIEVYVDKYVFSTLPVIIETKGELSENLVISEMVADLSQTNVQLPSLALEQISYIGAIVDLSGVTASTVINCEPVLLDSEKNEINLKNVIVDTKNIAVNITVEHIRDTKITPKVTNMEKFAKGFTVTVAPKSIDLCGEKEILDKILTIETKEITLSKQVKEGDILEAKLDLPKGTHLKSNVEDTVKLMFNKK